MLSYTRKFPVGSFSLETRPLFLGGGAGGTRLVGGAGAGGALVSPPFFRNKFLGMDAYGFEVQNTVWRTHGMAPRGEHLLLSSCNGQTWTNAVFFIAETPSISRTRYWYWYTLPLATFFFEHTTIILHWRYFLFASAWSLADNLKAVCSSSTLLSLHFSFYAPFPVLRPRLEWIFVFLGATLIYIYSYGDVSAFASQ